jgi:hypothetical protein
LRGATGGLTLKKILPGKIIVRVKNKEGNSVPWGFGRVKSTFGTKRQRNFCLNFLYDDKKKLIFPKKKKKKKAGNSVLKLYILFEIFSQNFGHFSQKKFHGKIPRGKIPP